MYDGSKVIPGIIIFVLLMTCPIWYNLASGESDNKAEPQKASHEKCIKDTDYMRAWHMDLLNTWRDEVVRGGDRFTKGIDGKTYEKSLTKTCMKCHTDQKKFCNECHDYAGVSDMIYCWECHVLPEESK